MEQADRLTQQKVFNKPAAWHCPHGTGATRSPREPTVLCLATFLPHEKKFGFSSVLELSSFGNMCVVRSFPRSLLLEVFKLQLVFRHNYKLLIPLSDSVFKGLLSWITPVPQTPVNLVLSNILYLQRKSKSTKRRVTNRLRRTCRNTKVLLSRSLRSQNKWVIRT